MYFSIYFLRTARLLAAGLLVGLSLPAQAQNSAAPAPVWNRRFGGAGIEDHAATVATADGGYLLAGSTYSNGTGDMSQLNQGVRDFWAVKIDANGTKQWDRRLGGDQPELLYAAIQTADGGYLLAGATLSSGTGDMSQPSQGDGDFWVVKLDVNGTKQWDRRFGGTFEDVLLTAIQTTDGGYLLAGYTTSDGTGDVSQPTRGDRDGWAVKISTLGIKQWERRFGGTQTDVFTSALQTSDGGYLLCGNTNSGVSGDISQPSRGIGDYWVVKTDAAGTTQWDRRFGGNNSDDLVTALQAPDGGYLLAGWSVSDATGDKSQPSYGSGNTAREDYWVVKTDAAGTKLWDRRYGGASVDLLTSACLVPGGGFLLAGTSRSGAEHDRSQPSQGRDDYWLLRIGSTGTPLWDRRLGGPSDDTDPKVVARPSGGFLVAGTSDSGASGDKTQPSQGLLDFWAVRLGAEVLATAAAQWSTEVWPYPNPAHASCTVTLPTRAAGAVTANLSLFDVVGRELRRQPAALGPAPTRAILPLAGLAAGVYLLRVTVGETAVVRRLEVR